MTVTLTVPRDDATTHINLTAHTHGWHITQRTLTAVTPRWVTYQLTIQKVRP